MARLWVSHARRGELDDATFFETPTLFMLSLQSSHFAQFKNILWVFVMDFQGLNDVFQETYG